jgi:dipeptidase D
MNRILYALTDTISIAEIDGGSLRNAIPRESNAIITTNDTTAFKSAFDKVVFEIQKEYKTVESDLEIIAIEVKSPSSVLSSSEQKALVSSVYSAHNGVFRMSPDIENLVETSNNIARIIVKDGAIKIGCLTRSSVESGKWDMAFTLKSTFELGGFSVEFGGSYPGWKPNPDSKILEVMRNLYERMFNEKPNILACHAGLECGLLGTHYPEMDMISFGPTIKGAHSPDERASISSTQKYWKYLLETLKNIPEKN